MSRRKKVHGPSAYLIQRRVAAPEWQVFTSASATRKIRELFGRDLTMAELAGLGFASSDSSVNVDLDRDGDIKIETVGPTIRAVNFLQQTAGGLELVMGHVRIRPELIKQGLGTATIAAAVDTGKQLKLWRIVGLAARGEEENGYYTFARLGFDGLIPLAVRTRLPAPFRHMRRVLDLMASEAGRRAWLAHGDTLTVSFALTEHSRSHQVLKEYLTTRGHDRGLRPH